MFNSTLSTEILDVKPYSNEEGKGIIVACKLQTTQRKIFDDLNLNGKEAGLSYILSGDVPVKGNKISLAFIKPEVELEFGSFKHLPVSIIDIATGPMDKGNVTVYLKLDVMKLDKDTAGELSANLKEIVDIKLRKTQIEH